MEDYKIKANEEFFLSILRIVKDGGTYVFPAANTTYTIEKDTLLGNQDALDAVKPLVSEEFFNKHLKLN
jgi:hypothetical protein